MQLGELEKVAAALPLVPGINGREDFYNSAVLLLLVPLGGEYHIVFEKRSAGIRQGGEICFPGGGFQKGTDTDFEMTALRETSEELGIPQDKIKIVGRLNTVVAPMGQIVEVFVGVSGISVGQMVIDVKEVEKVFSVPVSFFKNSSPEEYYVMLRQCPCYIDEDTGEEIVTMPSRELGLPERYEKPWGSFKHKILAYRTKEGTIWGMTARIIKDFISVINNSSVNNPV